MRSASAWRCSRPSFSPKTGSTPDGGKGRLDDQPAQVRQDVVASLRLAAPPRRRPTAAAAVLAEQVPAQLRQEGQQRRRLDQAAAQRVGHRHVARAHRLHQAGHAEERVAPQLQRIAEVVVEPAEDHVHRLQAAQQLEEDAVVAHRQVAALDQRVAEVAGQVGVLEIGLVVRPRREQDDARVVAVVRGDGRAASARSVRKNRASRCTWQSRKTSGSMRDRTMRFSRA